MIKLKNIYNVNDFKVSFENLETNAAHKAYDTIYEATDFSNKTNFSESLLGRGINSIVSYFRKNKYKGMLEMYSRSLEDEYLVAVFRTLAEAGYTEANITSGFLEKIESAKKYYQESTEVNDTLDFDVKYNKGNYDLSPEELQLIKDDQRKKAILANLEDKFEVLKMSYSEYTLAVDIYQKQPNKEHEAEYKSAVKLVDDSRGLPIILSKLDTYIQTIKNDGVIVQEEPQSQEEPQTQVQIPPEEQQQEQGAKPAEKDPIKMEGYNEQSALDLIKILSGKTADVRNSLGNIELNSEYDMQLATLYLYFIASLFGVAYDKVNKPQEVQTPPQPLPNTVSENEDNMIYTFKDFLNENNATKVAKAILKGDYQSAVRIMNGNNISVKSVSNVLGRNFKKPEYIDVLNKEIYPLTNAGKAQKVKQDDATLDAQIKAQEEQKRKVNAQDDSTLDAQIKAQEDEKNVDVQQTQAQTQTSTDDSTNVQAQPQTQVQTQPQTQVQTQTQEPERVKNEARIVKYDEIISNLSTKIFYDGKWDKFDKINTQDAIEFYNNDTRLEKIISKDNLNNYMESSIIENGIQKYNIYVNVTENKTNESLLTEKKINRNDKKKEFKIDSESVSEMLGDDVVRQAFPTLQTNMLSDKDVHENFKKIPNGVDKATKQVNINKIAELQLAAERLFTNKSEYLGSGTSQYTPNVRQNFIVKPSDREQLERIWNKKIEVLRGKYANFLNTSLLHPAKILENNTKVSKEFSTKLTNPEVTAVQQVYNSKIANILANNYSCIPDHKMSSNGAFGLLHISFHGSKKDSESTSCGLLINTFSTQSLKSSDIVKDVKAYRILGIVDLEGFSDKYGDDPNSFVNKTNSDKTAIMKQFINNDQTTEVRQELFSNLDFRTNVVVMINKGGLNITTGFGKHPVVISDSAEANDFLTVRFIDKKITGYTKLIPSFTNQEKSQYNLNTDNQIETRGIASSIAVVQSYMLKDPGFWEVSDVKPMKSGDLLKFSDKFSGIVMSSELEQHKLNACFENKQGTLSKEYKNNYLSKIKQ